MKKLRKILLVMVLGVVSCMYTNVHAAQTTVEGELPNEITRGEISYRFNKGIIQDNSYSNPFYNESADGKYWLFCSDRKNTSYFKDDKLTKDKKLDYGYVKILNQQSGPIEQAYTRIFQNNTYVASDLDQNASAKMLNTWILQMAIWGYQGTAKVGNDAGDVKEAEPLEFIDAPGVKSYELFQDAAFTKRFVAGEVWKNQVQTLINYAKNAVDPEKATMSLTMDGNWKDEGNYKKSGIISLKVSNTEALYSTYSVSLKDAADGVKVYAENGQQITNLNSIPAGTKIYFLVPKSAAGKSFTINAGATISYYAAYQYVDIINKRQPSILIGRDTKPLAAELVIVPDTARSISNSIYFIGFIILLSGAGIIYANVKPKKQED